MKPLSQIFTKDNDLFMRGLAFVAALLLFLMGILVWINFSGDRPANAPSFPHAGLSIERSDGQYFSYKVEVATTPEQELYGLMFRQNLRPETGMIFVYHPDQVVNMWMKNTYIPLDMLFVRGDGVIVKIISNARPLDLTPLASDEPVRAVIEINAGEAEKHGFKTGDKVLFSAFSKSS